MLPRDSSRLLPTAALAPGVGACACAAHEQAGFKSIFNGRDLAGWDADPPFWSVRDGTITGECTPQKQPAHNTFYMLMVGDRDSGDGIGVHAKSQIV